MRKDYVNGESFMCASFTISVTRMRFFFCVKTKINENDTKAHEAKSNERDEDNVFEAMKKHKKKMNTVDCTKRTVHTIIKKKKLI